MADKKPAPPVGPGPTPRERATRQKQTPAYKANMSSRMRARWGDKASKQRMLESRGAKQQKAKTRR